MTKQPLPEWGPYQPPAGGSEPPGSFPPPVDVPPAAGAYPPPTDYPPVTGFPPPVDLPPAAGAYPPPIDYPPITAFPPPSGDFAPPGSYPQTVAGQPSPYVGQPPPYGGYPPPPYGAYPLQQQGTNGLAIASLICSLFGPFICGIPSMVGFVLGLIAMNQIKKTGDGGRGVALAGVIVGAVISAFCLIGFILYVIGGIYAVSGSSRY